MVGNDYWHCLKCDCKLIYDPDEKWSDGRLYCEKCYDKLEAEFARKVIKQECWGMFELDGGEVQDWAEKAGLTEPCTATEADIDDDSDFDVGDTIYKFTEMMKGGE